MEVETDARYVGVDGRLVDKSKPASASVWGSGTDVTGGEDGGRGRRLLLPSFFSFTPLMFSSLSTFSPSVHQQLNALTSCFSAAEETSGCLFARRLRGKML